MSGGADSSFAGGIPAARRLRPLPGTFYEPSARKVAPCLLGHWLVRVTEAGVVGGVIVETEAYLVDDPACHGFRGRTRRNAAMFGPPGRAYVYFIYGNHWCFNTVCQPEGVAEAVLIRAIEPTFGPEFLAGRRPGRNAVDWTNGPAKFCQAMGIDRGLDGADLTVRSSGIFVAQNPEQEGLVRERGPVIATGRIGISQAADWPLRFYLDGSPWVSRRLKRVKGLPQAGRDPAC